MEGSTPESLQPLAPQAPGNILYGRFQRYSGNWKMWVGVAVAALLVWWLVKRFR